MAEKKELRIKLNLSNKYELDKVINGWVDAVQKMETDFDKLWKLYPKKHVRRTQKNGIKKDP